MSCWLGIDLGHARVGTALSDPGLLLAHPAGNIQAYGNYFHVLDDVVDMIEEHQVSRVIIGLPLQLNGSMGKSATSAQRWTQELQQCIHDRIDEYTQTAADQTAADQTVSPYGQSITEGSAQSNAEIVQNSIAVLQSVCLILRDERLTTVTAHHQMSEAGLGMRKHRKGVDQQAAVILLQSALDEYQQAQRQDEAVAHRVAPAPTEE